MADITVTPASVVSGSGATTADGIAGATLLAGQSIYIDTAASNVLKLFDANAVAPANAFAGIALHGASTGQPIKYQTSGLITIGATVVAGTVYVGSATPGGIAPAADIVTGWTVNIIGVATTTGIISMRPFSPGVTV